MPDRARIALVSAAALAAASSAFAGGSPENILLIINPASAESMYLGNYYKNARNIPDRNVLYITPTSASETVTPPVATYASFTSANKDLDGFTGYLANARLSDHIDFVVVAGTSGFFVDAPGYITDGCPGPVTRFSQSSVFAMAFLRNQILAGNMPVTTGNQYYSADPNLPRAFSSNTAYLGGTPSTSGSARRYYIGAQLGYTGLNGNTLPEILAMIDRSVAADGTRPAGTFYFMNTTDSIRNVRAGQFPGAVAAITSRGGSAQIINDVLPDGRTDCLGVMTGWADPAIDTSSMVLLPGSFGDHLTSWAAMFDLNNQTKISAWIRKGASGSAGEIEEPCNYLGKFPNANFHAIYFQGLSLGEAYLRSVGYVPFQGLLIADPMTRPFATFPSVSASVPGAPVSGTFAFTPTASTTLPGAAIASLDLYIDGVFHSRKTPGQAFTINTSAIPDGWHELRILASDNTLVRNTGRWVGALTTSNFGRSASLNVAPLSGNMTTRFQVSGSASGGTLRELRLLHNGRVVAAGTSAAAALDVFGRNLGSGDSRIQLEAEFTDGVIARSAPTNLSVAYSVGTFSNQAPIAYSFTKRVARGGPFVVELPARFDDPLNSAVYTIQTPPGQGTTVGAETRGFRIMTATASACGADQFTYTVTTLSGQSNVATVKLIYGPGPVCLADYDGNGQLNINDFVFFQAGYAAGDLRTDIDASCALNINDFIAFTNTYVAGCP